MTSNNLNNIPHFINIPHLRQATNMCVPTCAAMVLTAYGEKLSPQNIKALAAAQATDPAFAGTYFSDLVQAVRLIGYPWQEKNYQVTTQGFEKGVDDLIASVKAGKPVLVDTNTPPLGHTLLVVGYDPQEQQLSLLDPDSCSPGRREISYHEFQSIWYSCVAPVRTAIFTHPKTEC